MRVRRESLLSFQRRVRGGPRAAAAGVRVLPTEQDEQRALFQWAEFQRCKYPALTYLFAIPNAGAGASRGQAGKMKAEGAKPGVSDVFLPAPVGSFHGAWCELKALDGKVSKPQVDWLFTMRAEGYAVCLAYEWLQARNFFTTYLEGRYFHSPGYFPGAPPI